jgi:hypothetical protein
MIDMETVRELALALPKVEEHDHWGHPSFRVKNKIFATLWPDKHRVMVKLDPTDQAALVAHGPETYSPVPGGWGDRGATFVELQRISQDDLHKALTLAWRRVAPTLLIAAHDHAV